MRREELHYDLPPERIAQRPIWNRLDAKLLALDRGTGGIEHARFKELGRWLRAGDLLVLNDVRVLPARIRVFRSTGGKIDGLFLREIARGRWEVLVRGGGKVRPGEKLQFRQTKWTLSLVEAAGRGQYVAEVDPPDSAETVLAAVGRTPLPPYIRREFAEDLADDQLDRQRYQTEYARLPGAVAAPTAGLHFTRGFLDELKADGVETTYLTLEVGLGTFKPIEVERLEEHDMDAERFVVDEACAAAVAGARERGSRVIAVGTTTTRALESAADESGRLGSGRRETSLFIYPPYKFRVVDALITNFHLPGSTLIALVSAFAGREQIMAAYRSAIENDYRFYSYGDAMLIL
jgi:S-adenosylmethionine:tRNA ribosyltransferase-isomerase